MTLKCVTCGEEATVVLEGFSLCDQHAQETADRFRDERKKAQAR